MEPKKPAQKLSMIADHLTYVPVGARVCSKLKEGKILLTQRRAYDWKNSNKDDMLLIN